MSPEVPNEYNPANLRPYDWASDTAVDVAYSPPPESQVGPPEGPESTTAHERICDESPGALLGNRSFAVRVRERLAARRQAVVDRRARHLSSVRTTFGGNINLGVTDAQATRRNQRRIRRDAHQRFKDGEIDATQLHTILRTPNGTIQQPTLEERWAARRLARVEPNHPLLTTTRPTVPESPAPPGETAPPPFVPFAERAEKIRRHFIKEHEDASKELALAKQQAEERQRRSQEAAILVPKLLFRLGQLLEATHESGLLMARNQLDALQGLRAQLRGRSYDAEEQHQEAMSRADRQSRLLTDILGAIQNMSPPQRRRLEAILESNDQPKK